MRRGAVHPVPLQAAQADVPCKLAARDAANTALSTAQTNYDNARLDVFYAFYNESGDFFGAFDITMR